MPNKLNSNWVTTGEACEALRISDKQLWKFRTELFKQGTHYRNIARPHAARPTYRWHLARIEQLLDRSQEERGA